MDADFTITDERKAAILDALCRLSSDGEWHTLDHVVAIAGVPRTTAYTLLRRMRVDRCVRHRPGRIGSWALPSNNRSE